MIVNLDGKLTLRQAAAPRRGAVRPACTSRPACRATRSREDLPEDARCPDGTDDPACARSAADEPQEPRGRRSIATSSLEYRDAVRGRARPASRCAATSSSSSAASSRSRCSRRRRPCRAASRSRPTSPATASAARSTATSSSRRKLRVLYGAEAFHEWKPDNVTDARGRATARSPSFVAPYDLTRLPLLCPRIYDPAADGASCRSRAAR